MWGGVLTGGATLLVPLLIKPFCFILTEVIRGPGPTGQWHCRVGLGVSHPGHMDLTDGESSATIRDGGFHAEGAPMLHFMRYDHQGAAQARARLLVQAGVHGEVQEDGDELVG